MSTPINDMTTATPQSALNEMRKALNCLYIAVDEHVARDVCDKVWAAFGEAERDSRRLVALEEARSRGRIVIVPIMQDGGAVIRVVVDAIHHHETLSQAADWLIQRDTPTPQENENG